MTSVLRLHDLMTTSVDNCLRNECRIGLTDYQILTALQLSESGTWLLRRMAWHLMVHASTEFGLPGLSPSQARSMTATVARVRAVLGDLDRSYGSAPNDLR